MPTWPEYRRAYERFLADCLNGYQAIYWHARASGFGHDGAHDIAQTQSAMDAIHDFLIETGGK